MRVLVVQACRGLTDRERHIVYRRYFEDWTQAEIAMELQVTQMQVSRLLGGILAKLRLEMNPTSTPDASGRGQPARPRESTAAMTSAGVTASSAGSG